LKDRLHLCRASDDVLDAAAFTLCSLDRTVLIYKSLFLKRLFVDQLELLDIEGFLKKIVSAQLECLASRLNRSECRHQDHAKVGLCFTHSLKHIDTVHVRHFDVGDNNVRWLGLKQGERFSPVHGCSKGVAIPFEYKAQKLPVALLVVNDQNV